MLVYSTRNEISANTKKTSTALSQTRSPCFRCRCHSNKKLKCKVVKNSLALALKTACLSVLNVLCKYTWIVKMRVKAGKNQSKVNACICIYVWIFVICIFKYVFLKPWDNACKKNIRLCHIKLCEVIIFCLSSICYVCAEKYTFLLISKSVCCLSCSEYNTVCRCCLWSGSNIWYRFCIGL